MPSYNTQAIVLKKTKLKEKDLILTLLSQSGSQIRCVAKGARQPGSKFAAALELFSVVNLLLHEGKNLDTVTEAETIETNEGFRTDVVRLSYGAVVAELLEKTTTESQEVHLLFDITQTALRTLSSASDEILGYLVAAYLIKALSCMGFRPSFDVCVECGSARANSRGNGKFIISAGGWVCSNCLQQSGVLHSGAGRSSYSNRGSYNDGSSNFNSNHTSRANASNIQRAVAGEVPEAVHLWARALLGMKFSQIVEYFDKQNVAGQGGALAGDLLLFCEQWIETHLQLKLKSMSYLSRISLS